MEFKYKLIAALFIFTLIMLGLRLIRRFSQNNNVTFYRFLRKVGLITNI